MTGQQLVMYLCFFAAACGVVVGWWTYAKARVVHNGFKPALYNLGACFGVAAACAVFGLWVGGQL